MKVQFEGKETYLGKINFLTSLSIGPHNQESKGRYKNFQNMNCVKWSSADENAQHLNIDNEINGKAGITTACQHLEPPGLTK